MKARIHHNRSAGERHRGLGNIGGQHHLAFFARCEGSVLRRSIQATVEGQNGNVEAPQPLASSLDLSNPR
jgi:hypothetical protein